MLKYKVLLMGYGKDQNDKMLKNAGKCQIHLKDFDLTKRDLLFGIVLRLPLRRCPDE